MSFGNWDDVLTDYQEIYIHSRYSEHAKGMIQLIPRIREDANFADVLPGTSLSTLFLKVPNKETRVHIWCEEVGKTYRVYLYHHEDGSSDERIVDDSEIIPVLISYVNKIRDS